METDGPWERNPPEEEVRSRVKDLSFTLRGFVCRRTKQLWKMSTH